MTVRIGVLSTAHVHTAAYVAIVADHDEATLVGVTDDDAERGRDFARTHGTEFYDPDDLLGAVDAAIVCSENVGHVDWVERAATAGVDVLCEKPLGPTVSEAVAIRETCREQGIQLGVAMPLRFSMPAVRAKQRFEAGTIGELQFLSGTNRGRNPGGWFVDPALSGGGAVMDHTVHIVDLVQWLTGERVSEVYAVTDSHFEPTAVEDLNILSMELTDGTAFTLDGSWSKPDEWDFWGDATLELVGTEGAIDVDCFDQTFKLTRDTGEDSGVESVYWGSDPNVGLVSDFLDAVRDGRAPEITAADGVDAVAVVEAAYESAERGEPIPVEYVAE